jgi:hypothetical protein
LEPLWAKPRKTACNRKTGASLRSSPGHPRFNKAKVLTSVVVPLTIPPPLARFGGNGFPRGPS